MNKFSLIPSDVKTIIFDWDGTLHESLHIYKPAFLEAYKYLVENKYVQKYDWKDSEIAAFLGKNPKEMWESFTPKLPEDVIKKGSSIISEHMFKLIKEGKAILYPGALDVLSKLKEAGYVLVYLSNSKIYYMDAMKSAFNLDKYFDYILCSEIYDYIPKPDILAKVKKDFPKKILMIGDRGLDIDTGTLNDAYTIGCLYGYGSFAELNHADKYISSIIDLIK